MSEERRRDRFWLFRWDFSEPFGTENCEYFISLKAEGIYLSFCEEENINRFVAGALPGQQRPLRAPVAVRGLRLQEPSCNVWINSVLQIK